MSFTDLGIPVDAVESRTGAVCVNSAGDSRIVIAAKGFLLVADPVSGDCRQLFFPDHHSEYPYDTFSSRCGMLYVGAGNRFYVFDPFRLHYIDTLFADDENELCGFSYAENEEGHIYMTSYPQSKLYRYRPIERDFVCMGSMDPEQKYPSHMAVDAYGWVYIGTGTTKKNIVAYHPADSSTPRSLLPDELRTIGIGVVRQAGAPQAPCNRVYAQLGEQWVLLEQGGIVGHVRDEEVPASSYNGASFAKFHRQLPGDWELISHSLSNRELLLRHRHTGQARRIELRYSSEGAALSPIVAGADGCLYGTSNHPLHFFTYQLVDPTGESSHDSQAGDSSRLHNLGPRIVKGGNLAAYAVQRNILAGAAYPGGGLYLFDTSKPLHSANAEPNGTLDGLHNPRLVTEHIEIHRPRCAIALQDGEHIAYGGFPGYGMVGGALCVYHLPTGKDHLLLHTELVPNQSTVSLVETAPGILIGGTSVETPGGAEPLSPTARLYMLNWKERDVMRIWKLHDRIREYSHLLMDARGRLHILTSCSTYYVWDPVHESIVCEEDLSAWGTVVRQGWEMSEEDDCIYGALSQALFRIPLSSMKPERIAIPPGHVTAGFVKHNTELYFAISTHLWRYTLPKR
ncbi:hypothetical protein [Paenibacillus chungangensis]|uniref:Uncharacterized protein n=1 Tax=Paenibacillus chungangensis TaxID=696535 RepID=A0ABW3HQ84_9BACL